MQELEFVFCCLIFGMRFCKESSIKWGCELKIVCRSYVSLAEQQFEKHEKDAKEMLPDVDYKAATTRKRIRPNDGDTPEVYLIWMPEINFVSPPFTELLIMRW